MDVRHFVILECSHLANGCITKCGCIGLLLFRYNNDNNSIYLYSAVYPELKFCSEALITTSACL